MGKIDEHLYKLTMFFNTVKDYPHLDEEDRYWKLFNIKKMINWIRGEMGYDKLKFKKGTNEIIN